MPCPHCDRELTKSEETSERCPHCGLALRPPTVAVARTATVRVAEGEQEVVYRSISEIPADVRRKIQKAVHGPNSETIIIANPEGRDKIFQIIQGLPPRIQRQVLSAIGVTERRKLRLERRGRLAVTLGLAIFLLILLWWTWSR